jgi:hypothetical protein
MHPPRIWIEYRPIRIGWVIAEPDPALFAEAVRLTHCLWGGTYNPIIPAYLPELARSLCRVFNIDLLYGIGPIEKTQPFIDEFPHLRAGIWGREIFQDSCRLADVYHPMRKLSERITSMSEEKRSQDGFVLPTWQDDDPLANVFLATVGGYPAEIKRFDYKENYVRALKATPVALTPDQPVDVKAWRLGNPTAVAQHKLTKSALGFRRSSGVLVGSAADIEDLILFWNLTAAGKSVEFYDTEHAHRLRPWLDEFIAGQREWGQLESEDEKYFTIWSRSETPEHDLDLTGFRESRSIERESTWNGLNIKPAAVWFSPNHQDVVPTLHETQKGTSITFPLPNQPFFDDIPSLRFQHFISSVHFSTYGMDDGEWSLSTPFAPMLNEFYGRKLASGYANARSEKRNLLAGGALGVVTSVGSQRETVYPYRINDFLTAFFGLADIEVDRSDKGLICSRLIRQLGGVQGCRVLKICGVRNLIGRYGPEQSFTRGGAEQIIGNITPPENRLDFAAYEDLHIEFREQGRLTPADAFNYLLKKRVFRVGLDLTCPECYLKGWTHVDELQTKTTCQFCGTEFDMTGQLKDRDWRYRRSGLFGMDDHQGGSIPVALTLLQLHTMLDDHSLMYATSMNFRSKINAFGNCESDFVLLTAGRDHFRDTPVQILIGECKSEGGRIDEDDIAKLGSLADSISEEVAQTFIMFSKTGTFDMEELAIIKTLNRDHKSRVIIWSQDELEPYDPYLKHQEKLGRDEYAGSLTEMVHVTTRLFFSDGETDTSAEPTKRILQEGS